MSCFPTLAATSSNSTSLLITVVESQAKLWEICHETTGWHHKAENLPRPTCEKTAETYDRYTVLAKDIRDVVACMLGYYKPIHRLVYKNTDLTWKVTAVYDTTGNIQATAITSWDAERNSLQIQYLITAIWNTTFGAFDRFENVLPLRGAGSYAMLKIMQMALNNAENSGKKSVNLFLQSLEIARVFYENIGFHSATKEECEGRNDANGHPMSMEITAETIETFKKELKKKYPEAIMVSEDKLPKTQLHCEKKFQLSLDTPENKR